MCRALLVLALATGAAVLVRGQGALPPAFAVTPVFDNATATAIQLQLAPGAREEPHQHPYAMVVVYTAAANVQFQNGDTNTRAGRQPGDVDVVGRNVLHWAANVGNGPLEAAVIALKADRVPPALLSAPPALAGVTRRLLADHAEAAVNRVQLAAGVREPVHTHPYDLVVVVAETARLAVHIADAGEAKAYSAGSVLFVPRDTPHAFANLDTHGAVLVTTAVK